MPNANQFMPNANYFTPKTNRFTRSKQFVSRQKNFKIFKNFMPNANPIFLMQTLYS